MSTDTNAFAGSIAENYHRYLVPLIFDDYARDLAARVRAPEGGRVLEIACGTGVLTDHLRQALGDAASLVATDLSPAMVEAARTNVGRDGKVQYSPADGTDLPFPDASFDEVFCQFGVMFYPDKCLGYREAARVLRPGGTFHFNVWDSLEENPFCLLVHETVCRLFPEDPPTFLETPFGYHDTFEIEAELRRAGFTEIETTVMPGESRAASAQEVALALVAGSPLGTELAESGRMEASIEAVEAAVAETFGEGPVCAPMQSIAVSAQLPGGGTSRP